jgi:hypothetical protein
LPCMLTSRQFPYNSHSSALRTQTLAANEAEAEAEAEWTPFQTHCYSENVVAPGMKLETLDLQPGTLTTRRQMRP